MIPQLIFVVVLLACASPSLQSCPRPAVDSTVVLYPDQSSYPMGSLLLLNCSSGYESSAGYNYAWCYAGSPDYWYPAEDTLLQCTPATGYMNTPIYGYTDAPIDNDVECGSTSMTLYVDRQLLDSQDVPGDIHFLDDNCVGYYHDQDHVAITTRYDQCDTIQVQEADHIVFYNKVTYYTPRDRSGTNQVITREHILHINVTCKLEREETLSESFYPIRDRIDCSELGYGEFTITLERYTSASLTWEADDSAMVALSQTLYFGVKLEAYSALTVFIDSCWATPTSNPLDAIRYSLIENGCGVDSTVLFINTNNLVKGFTVDAFTFIGDHEQVFVHCDILVCDSGDANSRCERGCVTRARRDLESRGSQSNPHTLSLGPLSAAKPLALAEEKAEETEDSSVSTVNALVIAAVGAVALVALIALVVVKRMRARPQSRGYSQVEMSVPDQA